MRNAKFITIGNFSESANKMLNQAIYFSREENCGEVNLVHLFLAYLYKSDYGKEILDKLGITFDMLINSYRQLASQHTYGELDNKKQIIETFTQDTHSLILESVSNQLLSGEIIDEDNLFQRILSYNSDELNNFMDYIGISVECIQDINDSRFYIPDELRFFVEDITETVLNSGKYISNVDKYTDEVIEVLSRKIKANPCLVGEAGVGKTTIVYDLARRIASGNICDELKDTHVVYLNSSLLTAGTRYRGEFEERMAILLSWASDTNTILFLDEMHNFVDLNKSSGSGSAGNMIKKYLSDGTIRIIGTTTNKEYHSYIECDKALDRRIQKIIIKEPSEKYTIDMIKNTIAEYENFHNVKISDEVIDKAVKLSVKYIKNKFLPDKAYTILDQAAAHSKIKNSADVTVEDIEYTVSKITGIDINKLNTNEIKRIISLEDTISKNLIGQKNAVTTVCKAIKRSKAGVRETNKPIASFLFVGPTGVGKTELCKVLSKEVSLGDMPLIKVDMSEYSEKYSTSKMIGSAPGYVGYGEGGQLTEKIKNNPYSLVLFDEIEKAHPDVFNIFLQMLDEGRLTDGEGDTADLTNCIIIMTSNAGYGADGMQKGSLGFAAKKDEDTHKNERLAMEALQETFKPEFLNRIDNIVIFEKLTKEDCEKIVKLELKKLNKRISDKNIKIKFNKSIIDKIINDGYSDKYGARHIKREIQNSIEDTISDYILAGELYSGCNASMSFVNNQIKLIINDK